MAAKMKLQFFIQNPVGENPVNIGDWGDRPRLMKNIADWIEAEMEMVAADVMPHLEVKIFGRLMTDVEVERLPEL
jgi:hypothetical protein